MTVKWKAASDLSLLLLIVTFAAGAADVDYAKAVSEAQGTGNMAAVGRLCQKWAGAEPGDERPRLILGRTLSAAGLIDQAIEQFELAAEANPLSPEPQCEMGLLFLQAGRADAAVEEFDAALGLDGTHLPSMLGKARVRLFTGDAKGALGEAQQASQLDPKNAAAAAAVGDCLCAVGELASALVEFQRAVALDPANADAVFGLARTCQASGKEKEAQAHWRRFLQIEPSGERADTVRNGWVVLRTRKVAEGGDWLGGGVTWSPDGRHLAYLTLFRTLVILPLDTLPGARRDLATAATRYFPPVWSPDGKHIAVLERNEKDWTVIVVPADGTEQPEQLARGYGLSWSPVHDGKLFFDAVWPAKSFRSVALDGQHVGEAVTPGHFKDAKGVTWGFLHSDIGPGGQRIVCTARQVGTPVYELFVFDVSDVENRRQLTNNGHFNATPDFSPDGRSIAYVSNVRGGFDLWGVAADGSAGPTVLARFGDTGIMPPAPGWSPDGRELAYGTRSGMMLARLGGLDSGPVGIVSQRDGNALSVVVTGRLDIPQKVSLRWEAFDANSMRVGEAGESEGPVELKPGERVECPIELTAEQMKSAVTIKVTVLNQDGIGAVKLVDCGEEAE